ncbi:MAG: TldD/PmbA family protein [Chloroflexi bacterium]|nr:TldD/PmbA family protein [Chloroflexota bacterium]
MPQRVQIDAIDKVRAAVSDLVTSYPKGKRFCRYADVRIEVDEGKVAVAENGMDKFSGEDYGFAFGVRVIASAGGGPASGGGANAVAPGYFGQILGATDLPHLSERLREGLDHAYERALANARQKSAARESAGPLGAALYDLALAPINVRRETIPAKYEVNPREVALEDATKYVREVSQRVQGLDEKVVFNYIAAATQFERILVVTSEGADIDQTWAITQGTCFVVAQGPDGHQELYDFSGHQRGWELITKGIEEPDISVPSLMDFSLTLARDTIDLAGAKPLKATDKEVVVVTDPHYNALVCHEVVGHPSELDRALKFETGYAGRSWLLKDLRDNQIGKRVGSEHVNAFSDPTIQGFGHYRYDDEGTPARRVYHIRSGMYEEFANSRQTAALMGVEPNGHFKATEAYLVPLIRMSNTAFAPGERDPQDIIREVDNGYYVVGHRIPSVAESRENFRITAMKVYEIRDGEVGELFRDGGLMADTRDYFLNVDAVGNDFRLFAIPNCGKGQPMQTKRMSNGGPTMRSRARLSGA